NTGETCGGRDAMTVYENNGDGGEPTPAPVPVGGPEFLGCFGDVNENRIMTGPNTASTMSAEV
ncbi:unnamed protein product, partial [Laminaria digitata]